MADSTIEDKPVLSLFSTERVTLDEYRGELTRVVQGGYDDLSQWIERNKPNRTFQNVLDRFDPAKPLAHIHYHKAAIYDAFGRDRPDQNEMADLIGVSVDTLRGWVAPKDSVRHREVDTEAFAKIVEGAARHLESECFAPFSDGKAQKVRRSIAHKMLDIIPPEQKDETKRHTKVLAIALKMAALDDESLNLLANITDRIFDTAERRPEFESWRNDAAACFNIAVNDDLTAMDGDRFFELVEKAREQRCNLGTIHALWEAQPDESPFMRVQ